MAKGNEARVLDGFGPNFLIETNGPVGVGGGIAYQIYSVNDKDYVWQQALHQSGLATMEADGSLEIQTGYKNKEGEKVSQTVWHDIVLWRGLAEIAEKYLKKGSSVYIEGKIRNRKWEDKEGITRYKNEILADNMTMLGSRPTSEKSNEKESQNQENTNGYDDLPF